MVTRHDPPIAKQADNAGGLKACIPPAADGSAHAAQVPTHWDGSARFGQNHELVKRLPWPRPEGQATGPPAGSLAWRLDGARAT